MTDEITGELVCDKCGKECKTNFGLTNHMKACKGNGKTSDPVVADSGTVSLDRDADTDPRYAKPQPTKQKPIPGGEPFSIGAFYILADHMPLLLDINFADALGDHILNNGSSNRAILAFGHQLKKAAGGE